MAVNGLTRDELLYELRLRQIEGTDFMTIKILRETLEPLLSSTVDLNFSDVELNISSEVEICRTKIAELKGLISSFSDSLHSSVYNNFDNRILHVLSRLRRLTNRADVTMQSVIKILLDQVISLDEELNARSIGNTEQSPISFNLCPSSTSNHLVSSTPNASVIPSPRSELICKWGIIFDGSSPVTEFLERVEEIRVSRHVSKEHLYSSAVELFSGSALLWFRSMKTVKFSDWDSLTIALRDHFLPPNYDHELLCSVYARKQKLNEKVIDYVSSLCHMMNSLSAPVSEAEQLRILKRNLLSSFQQQLVLAQINTVPQLIEILIQLEHAGVGNHECVSNIKNVSCLGNDHSSVNPNFNQVSVVSSGIKCWNCADFGHYFRDCSKQRKKFCFSCGENGVIRSTCPKCRSATESKHLNEKQDSK